MGDHLRDYTCPECGGEGFKEIRDEWGFTASYEVCGKCHGSGIVYDDAKTEA